MIPDKNELKSLLGQQNTLCVSLYLPLRFNTPRENLVRAGNLLKEAEEKAAKVTCPTEAHEFVRPLWEAVRARIETPLGGRGLAAFASPGFHREFHAPIEFPELVSLDRRFYLLPLLPLFTEEDRFYILAISQKHVRLLAANRMGASEISVEGMPTELDHAHQDFLSEGFEKELQLHASAAGGAGKRGVIYHGGANEPKDRFSGYLRGLCGRLLQSVNLDGAPLVVASVERVASLYRDINSYPNLVEGFVAGNPDLLTEPQLQAKAWEIVQPYLSAQRALFLEKFRRFPKSLISYDVHEIVAEAEKGRVRTLFLAEGASKRDAEGGDLLNQAAWLTLHDSGQVYAIPGAEMPEKAEIAAAYRY